jgi:hypothetical protein
MNVFFTFFKIIFMDKITLVFTRDEINLIFKALSNEPFKDVYELMGNINKQLNAQPKRSEFSKKKVL